MTSASHIHQSPPAPCGSDTAMTAFEKRSAISLAGIFALRMLGLFIILPVFVVYAKELPGGQNDFFVGLTMGIYGLTQSILQIPYGRASDRYGRKPVIFAGLIIFALGSFIAACASSLWIIMLGRALQGAGAISAAVTALVSDNVRNCNLSKAMAMIGASIGTMFAISLLIAPALAHHFGLAGVFALPGILAVLAVFCLFFIVPPQKENHHLSRTAPHHKHWFKLLADPQLLRLNLSIFTLHTCQMALFVVVPPRLVSMGLPISDHWYVYLPAIIFSFACMAKPIIWADRQQKSTTLLRICVVAMAIVFTLFGFLMHSIWEVATLLGLFFTCFNILEATLPGLVSRIAPKSDKGLALGIYNTSQSLGLFAGGAVGGCLSEHFSAEVVFGTCVCLLVAWAFLARGLREPVR